MSFLPTRLQLCGALLCGTTVFLPQAALAQGQPPGSPATSQADSTDLARQRFTEATEAYTAQRYSAAASLFEAADRLAPHASTRYNAATAWEQAGEYARAATGYQAALDLGELDDGRRLGARQRLAALRANLAQVKVPKPLGALLTVDHVQKLPLPARFYLQPGDYQFGVEFRGTIHSKQATVQAGRSHTIEFHLNEPLAMPRPEPPLKTSVPDIPPPGSNSTWTWVAAGASIAFSGAAIILGLNAKEAETDYRNSEYTDPDALTRGQNLELATNIAWGGATAAGVTGLVLLLRTPEIRF